MKLNVSNLGSLLLLSFLFLLSSNSTYLMAQIPYQPSDFADQPTYYSYFNKALCTGGNSFVVAGIAKQYSTSSWPGSYPNVRKIDSAGSIEWEFTSGFVYHEDVMLTTMMQRGNGELILSYWENGCDYYEGRARIEKLSPTGALIWSQSFANDQQLGMNTFNFKASAELASGNFLFASDSSWGGNDYGFLKISPIGDSIGFYSWSSASEVEDMESTPWNALIVGGGYRVVHIDTLGQLINGINVPDEVVDVDVLPGNRVAILTLSKLYLADTSLALLDSVSLTWFGSAFPISVESEGTDFWITATSAIVKVDANLNYQSQILIPASASMYANDIAMGTDAFMLAGFSGPIFTFPNTHFAPQYSVARSVTKAGQWSTPSEDIGVESIEIVSATYDPPSGFMDVSARVIVKNYGTTEVDDFHLNTPFGVGFGWICGGAMFTQHIAPQADLMPGDTTSFLIDYFDGMITQQQAQEYHLTFYTTCPNRRMDSDTTNDAHTVLIDSVVLDLNPLLELDVNLYPNPVIDKCVVEISNLNERARIEITDLFGRVVLVQGANEGRNELSLQSLAQGIYVVKISSDRREKIMRLVKD